MVRSSASTSALGTAAQFEVIPLGGIVDQVLEHLPAGTRVTVTASPAQGLEATIGTACALAQHGMIVIPHLAARMIRGPGETAELLDRLAGAGVEEVFVIAGDASVPAGEFPGALPLLEAIAAADHGTVVGIGAHPEGHPFLAEEVAREHLRAKAEHAHYAVTQMCFSAAPLLEWARGLRASGIALPVRPGVAAPVGTARLLRIGTRIGVGRSLRLLAGEDSGMRRLLAPGRWDPAPLLAQLRAAAEAEPSVALLGPHVYTFNDLGAAAECLPPR
ncbi:methylenetetrahydrofolate reductase [Brachybacterium sp. AOP43-C2-M15]|uniref:methylenetetrahydrofolate reductase n=1 Tax=Brachybacterium sp. AOP43-C2-M15 TaxID=3457661 RepID=UPI0040341522